MTIEVEIRDLALSDGEQEVQIEALSPEDLLDFARYNEVEALTAIAASEYAHKLASLDENGTSLVHMAAANGHVATLHLLLTHPGTKKLLNHANCGGNTPLHWAALNGHTESVKLLLESGADLRLENASKRTAFDEAVALEKFEVTSAIIEFLEKNKKEGDQASEEAVEDSGEENQ